MAKKRAGVISARDLSRTVDNAVKLAIRRHEVKATASPTLLVNWEIIGRILRELLDHETAWGVANDVTKKVAAHGIQGQPAVVQISSRDILVGFIERAKIAVEIGGL